MNLFGQPVFKGQDVIANGTPKLQERWAGPPDAPLLQGSEADTEFGGGLAFSEAATDRGGG